MRHRCSSSLSYEGEGCSRALAESRVTTALINDGWIELNSDAKIRNVDDIR